MTAPHYLSGTAWRRYLALLCGGAALLLMAVSLLNYMVDPYMIHQWDSAQLQRLRPTREKLSAWGKTYAIARWQPAIVYVGNSRTELGLPTRVPAFLDKRVFNGALSGASVADAIAMVGYAANMGKLDTVVWGIDAPSFSMAVGNTELEPALLTGNPWFFARRALLNLKRGLSLDMTEDSLRLLSGSFGSVCHSNLLFFGQRDAHCFTNQGGGWSGTRDAMRPRLSEFARGQGPSAAAMSAFSDSIARLCEAGTRVRLYINPTHALTLDVLYWSGKWPAMERWQASLVRLLSHRRSAGCDVTLHDFSGYNSVTSEHIPLVTQHNLMTNYWEASHYRANVGVMILTRMFGQGDAIPAQDFGVELDEENMDSHLAMLRAERERYHQTHLEETAFARSIAQAERGSAGKQ
jgi:hypothetical protein